MANYDWIGSELVNKGVIETTIFMRFPELIPKGGENYWQGKHSKLLLIGESNYFKNDIESISDFKHFDKWYKGENSRLIPDEMKKNVNNWKSGRGFNNLFKSMKKVLNEEGITDYKDDLLHEIVYYNYFLRPASVKNKNCGFEKDCKPIDCEVSYSALCGIIEEIKPNIVIFVSKFSYWKFMEFHKKEEKHFHFVNHFSRACWSEPDGQQKFEKLLRDHWVNKNPNYQKLQAIHNLLMGKFQNEIYKPSDCGIDKGIYLSCLNLKINDKTFCCQTEIEIKINDVIFWTYFYETDNCEKILALVGKEYNFKPAFSSDIVVDSIEKLINQIIEEIS
jgi:hypothetical protein